MSLLSQRGARGGGGSFRRRHGAERISLSPGFCLEELLRVTCAPLARELCDFCLSFCFFAVIYATRAYLFHGFNFIYIYRTPRTY